jgi:serine/threonine protein phosphatase PrpC
MMYAVARFADSYRADTEDRADIIPLGDGEDGIVLVVADGVGGRSGGGAAAESAVRRTREAVPSLTPRESRDPRTWYRLAKAIDEGIAGEEDAGETTLVILCVTPRRLVGVSVGDSEAWLVTSGGHYDLTGGQKRKPYLGEGMADPVPFALPNPGYGTLLVATDGLFKYAPPERISDAALQTDLEEAARRVADEARLTSGRLSDDIVVLLCRLGDKEVRPSVLRRLRDLLIGG